jgi:hypothetical protein
MSAPQRCRQRGGPESSFAGPLLHQINRPLQRGEGALKILQPLNPANVRGGHGVMLALQTTGLTAA